MADPWNKGSTGAFHYEVLGYQLENGLRIEGIPDTRLMDTAEMTAILVHVHPKDDEEGGKYFWVHGHALAPGSTIVDWLRLIQIAAAGYEMNLEFDIEIPDLG